MTTTHILTGECLCQAVQFSIKNPPKYYYQCHCDLCKKQTGTAFNMAFIIHLSSFEWLNGLEQIHTYQKPTGFRSCFCRNCGCSVPNQVGDTSYIWVPLGLLTGYSGHPIAHLFASKKPDWDTQLMTGSIYEQMPALSELFYLLHPTSTQ